jgi:transmembrane sensor
MIDKSKEELMLRCLQGRADNKEYEIAYRWINADKSNCEYYESLRDAWIVAGIVKQKSEYDCRRIWARIARRTGIRVISFPEITAGWSRIAAVVIIAFICGVVTYHLLYEFLPFTRTFGESEFVVEAPLGAKSRIVLSDSTKVWLNAGSTLKYSTGYNASERDVYLTGEGYFEVASNKKLPFRVHASDLVIHAIGTEFNVKAYPEEGKVETTLVSGMVSLERKTDEGQLERVLLRPNQRVSITPGERRIDVARVTPDDQVEDIKPVPQPERKKLQEKIAIEPVIKTEVYTSWKDKRFIFESERMADLVVKLERIYDVRISFEDEELKDYRLTGALEQETLEQLLDAIRLTIPIDFSIKQNNVVLTLNRELKERYNRM